VELESVVMKALAKRKQDRFQTARDFSRALQNYLLRRGAFVGPEEVSGFLRHIFSDRIQKREAHLAWAAEVTGTVNVDQLRQQGGAQIVDEISLVEDDDNKQPQRGQPQRGQQQQHGGPTASGARPVAQQQHAPPQQQPIQAQMAAESLMDDDEDVPTTVATRDQIEIMAAAANPRPAPGPAMAQQQGPPGDRNSAPRPAAGMPAGPGAYGRPQQDERTAALPSGMYGSPAGQVEDLGATVALPSSIKQREEAAAHRGGGFAPPPAAGGGYGQQQGGYGQQPYPPPQQQQGGYGQQQQGGFNPAQAYPGGPPQNLPPLHPQTTRQSQIETAVSLPRPDPAAVWLAQQDVAHRGQPRKNTGMIVAIVALTALCVIGVSALLYYKFKMQAAPPVTPTTGAEMSGTSTPAPAPAPSPSPSPNTPAATPSATPTAAPTTAAAPTAAPAKAPSSAPTTGAAPAGGSQGSPAAAAAAPAAAAPKEEPGFLTVVCNPFCDDVSVSGRSLGPSPVVHVSVKPGQHRITLKRGTSSKVISVIVVAGQVTAQRVSM
jgi:serine/threonine-protein kinase